MMKNCGFYIYTGLIFILYVICGLAYYEIVEDPKYYKKKSVQYFVDKINWVYDITPKDMWSVKAQQYYDDHKVIEKHIFPFILFIWGLCGCFIYSNEIYKILKHIYHFIGYKVIGEKISISIAKHNLLDHMYIYWYIYIMLICFGLAILILYFITLKPLGRFCQVIINQIKEVKIFKIMINASILTLLSLNLGYVIYNGIRFNEEINKTKWVTLTIDETWRKIIILFPNLILPIITLLSRLLWFFGSDYALAINVIATFGRLIRNHMISDVYNDVAMDYFLWLKMGNAINNAEYYLRKLEILSNLYNSSKKIINYNIIFQTLVGCYDVHISSKCSFNDVESMYEFLSDLKILNRIMKYKKFYKKYDLKQNSAYNHYNYIPDKYTINRLPSPEQMKCEFNPETDREPVTNIGPQIMGQTIIYNTPFKLHKCVINECEAVYRQVQCKIRPDKKIVKEFLKYTRKWIDSMIDEYYEKFNDIILLSTYFSKLGSKSEEYENAYVEYQSGKIVDLRFKMHPKTDEKIVINWEEPKGKARNISAQQSIAKLLMGLLCEYGMRILHVQPWCGPGMNYDEKCEKFEEWDRKLGGLGGLLCCDGSSFDSTQHREFIEGIDKYFLEELFNRNKEKLLCYFNLSDIHDVIAQTTFEIYSQHFTFTIQGTQLSGRMNTCLSNTMRSAAYIKFIIYKMESKMKVKLEFILIFFEVTGDDQVIMTPEFLKKLYEYFAYKFVYSNKDISEKFGLGQICKIFDWYPNKNGAEYLSCHILYNKITGQFLMIRKIDRFLQLIPYTFKNAFKNIKKYYYMKQQLGILVADALIQGNASIKLYQEYGFMLKRIIESQKQLENPFHSKSQKAYNNKISQLEKHLKYSKHNQIVKEGFNEIFEEFLFEKYQINKADIQEYYDALNKFNDVNQHCNITLVDKIYNNLTPKEFIEVYGRVNEHGYKVYRSENNESKEFCEIIVKRNSIDEL